MLSRTYQRSFFGWRARRDQPNLPSPPRVRGIEWILAVLSVLIALAGHETRSYSRLALTTQILVLLSFILLILSTREVFRMGSVGKFFLVAGVFVFYWIDALTLSLKNIPFGV